MYPKADVPVVQPSLDRRKQPGLHYDLGRELRGLRKKGVLIIGSGNIVHNLREMSWEDTPLLYVLGAQEKSDGVNFFADKVTLGSMSMRLVRVG